MAVYGKLSINRLSYDESGTITVLYSELNTAYDTVAVNIIGAIPSDERAYYDSVNHSWYYIEDHMILRETDCVSSQIKSLNDIPASGIALLRRWLSFIGSQVGISQESEFGDDLITGNWNYDITGTGGSSNVYVDQGSGIQREEGLTPSRDVTLIVPSGVTPDVLGTIESNWQLELTPERPGRNIVLEKAWTWEWISRPVSEYRQQTTTEFLTTARIPYPLGETQNIYSNNYLKLERVYANVAETYSRVIDRVPGIALLSQERGKVLDNNTIKILALSKNMNLAASVTQYRLGEEMVLSNTNEQKNEAVREQRSNSNLTWKEIPTNVSATRMISVNDSFSGNPMFTQGDGGKSGITVKRIAGISTDGIAGNSTTDFQAEQLIAHMTEFISSSGETRLKTKKSNLDIGSVKLYNTSKRVKSNVFAKISISSDVSIITTTFLTENNILIGKQKTGCLGVESFDDFGYNGWYAGKKSIMFTENINEDVGYNGWDKGTGFTSGKNETFDQGWTAGFSPYSRVGESVVFAEDLSSQTGGSKVVFSTTYTYVRGTLQCAWNGQEQVKGVTFTETSQKTFTTSFIPGASDYLTVQYDRFYGTQPLEGFAKTAEQQFNSMIETKIAGFGNT